MVGPLIDTDVGPLWAWDYWLMGYAHIQFHKMKPECFLCGCVPYVHIAAAAKSLQSCLTLWDPIDGSPPGSPVPGILQSRTLEWVAISFSNA